MAIPLIITGGALALVGIATATTAGVIGSVEQHNQARQAAQNAEDNARLQQQQLEYNKRMEMQEAATIEAENQENARRQRMESESLRASQIALLGKSGAAMSSGSPLAVLGQSAADEELKIRDLRYMGARSASAHTTKATDYGFGATIAGQNAVAAKNSRPSGTALGATIAGHIGSGAIQAGTTILSATSAYNAVKK